MSYTKIDKSEISNVLTKTNDHHTGHVYLLDSNRNLILGHNKKYDNVCSFGGFSEVGETLLDTIIREFKEESLECVFPAGDLKKLLLEDSIIITRNRDGKQFYTAFCNVKNYKFNLEEINKNFTQALTNPDLKAGQKENDRIVIVNLDTIANAIKLNPGAKQIVVPDITNNNCNIRDINIPAYQWFIQSLADNNLDNMF